MDISVTGMPRLTCAVPAPVDQSSHSDVSDGVLLMAVCSTAVWKT